MIKIDSASLMQKAENIKELTIRSDIENAIQIWNPKVMKSFLELAMEKYDLGESIISDAQFDVIYNYYILKGGESLKPKETDETIPIYLSSLDKILEDKIESWIVKNPWSSYMISDKLDGMSLCIIYMDGKIDKIYTKGAYSGKNGSDLTHLAEYFNSSVLRVINTNGKLIVRGELIVSKEKFKTIKRYKNPRNMVAGITKRKLDKIDSELGYILNQLDFVTYEVMFPRYPTDQQFNILESYGFNTVDHHEYNNINKAKLDEILINRRTNSPYDIDGIVIMNKNLNPITDSGNPDYAIAYKMSLEDQTAETEVIAVEWKPSRHGQIKPTIRYKPVIISGSTYQLATGHNAKFILDNKIGPGSKIIIIRGGDINPFVEKVLSESVPAFPEDVEWHWNKTGVDINLDDIEYNVDVEIKRLTYFCKEMGIKGIGEGTITKFVNNGWDLDAILSANQEDFKEIDRIGDKLALKLYESIQNSIKNVTLNRVMVASGSFGIGLGDKKITGILQNYPDILERYEQMSEKEFIGEICELPGFAEKTATNFYNGLGKFINFMKIHKNNITISNAVPDQKEILEDGLMQGEVVVMTGFRDAKLANWIEYMGGKTGTTITGSTTILLVKDLSKGTNTAKFQKAKEKGVKIYQKDSFVSEYRIQL